MVRILAFSDTAGFQSLVRELRCPKPLGRATKKEEEMVLLIFWGAWSPKEQEVEDRSSPTEDAAGVQDTLSTLSGTKEQWRMTSQRPRALSGRLASF